MLMPIVAFTQCCNVIYMYVDHALDDDMHLL